MRVFLRGYARNFVNLWSKKSSLTRQILGVLERRSVDA